MKFCPTCSLKCESHLVRCPVDGTLLKEEQDPLIDTTIAGRYRVLERIGEGGMGMVYKVSQDHLDRIEAMKILASDLVGDPVQKERFFREARAANRIDHPNIIKVHDMGQTGDGLVYMVMDFLKGRTLGDVIDENGFLPCDRVKRIMIQVTRALARAHDCGIIHRDLKPHNIMLQDVDDMKDIVKILDFGLAKITDATGLTTKGDLFGTPEYISPEQCRGEKATSLSDLYALGVVAYEMLTGRPPFIGSPTQILMDQMKKIPSPMTNYRSDVPAGLEKVVMQLLSKNPRDRFTDARHLLDELDDPGSTEEEDRIITAVFNKPSVPPGQQQMTGSGGWRRRLDSLKQSASSMNAPMKPDWMDDVFERMEKSIYKAEELDEVIAKESRKLDEKEMRTRQMRDRIGKALDALSHEHSRKCRVLESLESRIRDLNREVEKAQNEWRKSRQSVLSLEAVTETEKRTGPDLAKAYQKAATNASLWEKTYSSQTQLEKEYGMRNQERDDLDFQIAQLKGRLGQISAELDHECREHRQKILAMDEDRKKCLENTYSAALKLNDFVNRMNPSGSA